MNKFLFAILGLLMVTQLHAQGYKTTTNSTSKKSSNLGKDILAFYPFQILTTNVNDEMPDLTIGASYERIFDNEFLAVKLPFFASLQSNYYYFMPTLKIYPTKQGTVRFAVGPQLLIGYGKGEYRITKYDMVNGYYTQVIQETRKQFGFLINPSLNVTMSQHFYLNAESSLGIIYYDNMPYANSSYYNQGYSNNPISPAFQLSFSLGYRF